MEALRTRMRNSDEVNPTKGATLNVHPDDFSDFMCSKWAQEFWVRDETRQVAFQDVRFIDNPLMLEGVAILVKNDIIQAVVNLEDGRSMETL